MRARTFPLIPMVLALALGACGGPGDGADDGRPDAGDARDDGPGADVADPGDPGPADEAPGDPGAGDADAPGADAADDGTGPVDVPQDLQADVPFVPATAEGWCDAWSRAWCGFRERCGLVPADEASACLAAARATCWDGAFLADAAAAGGVAFDGKAGGRCLLALGIEGCDSWWRPLTTGDGLPFPECANVIAGLRPAGEACSLGVECAYGAWCRVGDACPGTCRAWAARDAACGFDDPCDPATDLCRDGLCVALPGAGEACPEGSCAAPLACDPAEAACRVPGGPDAACGPGLAPCAAGLVCLQASAIAAGTCTLPRGTGESCFEDADCRADPDGSARVCAGGTCGDAPGPGEPCWEFRCARAWCDTSALPPTCTALPAEGDACVQGGLCGDGLWCDGGTCRSRRASGLPCDGPWQCLSGRCLGGACRRPADPPCTP